MACKTLLHSLIRFSSALLVVLFWCGPTAAAQDAPATGREVYDALKQFQLTGGSAPAQGLVLKRDRLEMTFNGRFYFEAPVAGAVRGAVFLGKGAFRAEVPPSGFERDHVRRMLKADVVESEFETAVLRFSDDTFERLGLSPTAEAAPSQAAKLAEEFNARLLKETAANVAARVTTSILNQESPGFFIAQFDKGKRGRFAAMLDHQGRIPSTFFDINGGEKGIIFAYRLVSGNDVWMAFYALQDYERGTVDYSDVFDLITIPQYNLQVDLRDPRKALRVSAKAEVVSLEDNVRAIPFAISENLPEFDDLRKKKAMRITAARLNGATSIPAIQEEWEGGFLVILPAAVKAQQGFKLEMDLEGDFIYDLSDTFDCHYPLINGQWYPRHGYLSRSKFEITFQHNKKHKVAGPGVRVKEEPAPESRDEILTTYRIDEPVALVTFAVGPFKIYQEKRKLKQGELPIEFFSLEGSRQVTFMLVTSEGTFPVSYMLTIKEDFVIAEMGNAVDFMGVLFGTYPYPILRATFHPFGFGQGFATMLAIPNADRTSKYTFSFLSHETAHQWWGNIVAWRSYRDQWLSEGFAVYSGILYTNRRDNPKSGRDLLHEMRVSLKDPPSTLTGVGKGRLADVGPIILGGRLSTRETLGAYRTLIYNKGGLVLRMLHFLFTDPATGDGQPFFDMMTDFVRRHQNGWATTDSFREVASEHFARSAVGRRYGLKDLNWFFSQWVYQAHLPTYRLEYQTESHPEGGVLVKGTVFQDNAPDGWFMPLPLVFSFGRDQVARGVVHAMGPSTPVNIRLPQSPSDVQLDPDYWVLSEKTSTKRLK